MRLLIFLLLAVWTTSSFAEVEIEDPSGRIYEDIKIWTPGLPFSQAFTCGDTANFSATVSNCAYKCTDSYCQSQCNEATSFPKYDLFVEDCSAEEVNIYGENGFSAKVTKAEYEKSGNNWLIALLKSHPHFIQPEGKVILEFSAPRSVSMLKNGKKISVRGHYLIGTIRSQDTRQGFQFEVFLLPEEKGIRQIGYFRAGWEDIFFKLRGIIDDPTKGY